MYLRETIDALDLSHTWLSWLLFIAGIMMVILVHAFAIQPITTYIHKRVSTRTAQNPLYIVLIAIRYSFVWTGVLVLCIAFTNTGNITENVLPIWTRIKILLISISMYSYADKIVKNHLEDILHFFISVSGEEEIIRRIKPLLRAGLRILFCIIYILAIMNFVLGININAWLAGLGVLGLGASLALQDTFSNLIATITISASGSFKEGERITFNGVDGFVERIGLRNSTIRTLSGHVVIVPNSKLINEPVENITERPHIKRTMNIGITYDMPYKKIQKAVQVIKDILADTAHNTPLYEHADFQPKVYFTDFDSSQLTILVLYWYHPPNYWEYLAHAERINEQIFLAFEKHGIDFAFPTQTIHLAHNEKDTLARAMLAEDVKKTK